MKCFNAEFVLPNGGKSFSEIWATTKAQAEEIAAARGMGPVRPVTSPRKEYRPSVLATLPGGWARPDVLHSLCYLSFIAARHGILRAEDVTADDSPLHELAHFLTSPTVRGGKMREHLEARVRWLEESIPGMPPPDWRGRMPEDTSATAQTPSAEHTTEPEKPE